MVNAIEGKLHDIIKLNLKEIFILWIGINNLELTDFRNYNHFFIELSGNNILIGGNALRENEYYRSNLFIICL